MKKIIVFSALALLVAIFSGCSKDHLEIDTTGSVVTDHKIQKYNEDNASTPGATKCIIQRFVLNGCILQVLGVQEVTLTSTEVN